MNCFLDLFTPETWRAFCGAGATVTGFRERQRRLARERVREGDLFICYLTRLSRWCGVLGVQSKSYEDDAPIFDDPDPFRVRFRVEPLVILKPEAAIPIHDEAVWNSLSITRRHDRALSHWTGFFRTSMNRFEDADGSYLMELLREQQVNPRPYPLTDKDSRQLKSKKKVRSIGGEVEVEIPEDGDEEAETQPGQADQTLATSSRESIQIQAKVAQIGIEMGFRIWVPRNDRSRVLEHVPTDSHQNFLDALPLNYDDTTLRTVEQIDVLWLKGRSMARAFEIEHTTAIYSGLLRMADLLALQPNMDIRLHIVAPDDKRDKVLREIRRPVFSLLDRGPLYDQCSFLSYGAIRILRDAPHLSHMSDTIIDEYGESAEV